MPIFPTLPGGYPALPANLKLPFAYAVFDPLAETEGQSAYTVLLPGQMLPTGSAAPFELQRPMSAAQAAALFGAGSMLACMCAMFYKINSGIRVVALPVPDSEEGTAATAQITLSGTVSAATPLCLYIGGVLVRVPAPADAAAESVAAGLVNAINQNAALPVIATANLGQITITAKNKGECGNDIDLRFGYYKEPFPEGLQVQITPMSGGAGNPDPAAIIAAMGEKMYQIIAWPWQDAHSLAGLKEELESRWSALRQLDGQAITVMRGTYGHVTTIAMGRNDKHLTIIPSENSPTSPWEDAAACAQIVAMAAQEDPARPFTTLQVPGVLPPAEKDRWPDFPEKNMALSEGVSARKFTDDGVFFAKLVTTYRKNPLGVEDDAFLSLNVLLTLSWLRIDWNNYLKGKYPRHKLAGDVDAALYDPSQPIMTPKLGRAEAIARCRDVWVPRGMVEGFEAFKENLLCERNVENPNRLDWLLKPDLVNQFEIAGTLFRHAV